MIHFPIRKIAFGLLLLLVAHSVGVRNDAQAQGVQVDARMGHTALPALGRDTGITHFEFMPYLYEENERIIFGDVRGFINNEGNVGGNIAAGYRFLEPNDIFILGVHGGYGVDQSLEEIYQQMTLGVEGMTRFGSLTSNFYFPVGNDDNVLDSGTGNVRVEGNQIVLDTVNRIGEAMRGVDVNMGLFLPGQFAEERNLQANVGWYHFEGSNVETIDGAKFELKGDIIPYLQAQVGVSNDDTFGTNVTLGMSFRFGNNDVPEERLDRQFRRFVDTNYNVIVSERTVVGEGVALVNPDTGNPFVVQSVESGNTTAQDGTYDNPFATITDAQNEGGDIFYLKSGSTFNESITLNEGETLLGEGGGFRLRTENFGLVQMDQDPNAAPVTINSLVDTPAITLSDNTAVGGVTLNPGTGSSTGDLLVADGINDFQVEHVTINNSAGSGFVIDSSTNGVIREVAINGASQDGLQILNHDGRLQFQDISIDGAGRHGLFVSGGHGESIFSGDLTLNNNQQSGMTVEDLELITVIDDQGTTDTSDDVETDIFGLLAIENLELQGADGAKGVVTEDNEGLVDIYDSDIDTTNATGFESRNSKLTRIRDGEIFSTNAPAIDVEDSTVNITMESISANGGPFGIRAVDMLGTIIATGTNEAYSGGTIQNTDTAIFAKNAGSIGFQAGHFVDNETIADLEDVGIFELSSSEITGTTTSLVNALNVKQFAIVNNLFKDNTLTDNIGIDYQVDTNSGYVARVVRNSVKNSPRTFFNAQTQPGGQDSSLDLTIQANSIEISELSGIAGSLNWTGAVNAKVVQNLVTGTGGSQTAFKFETGDSSDLGTFTFTENLIGLTGDNSTAIEVLSGAPADLVVYKNEIEFQGTDGTGIRISADKTSELVVAQNLIDDYAGGATGILFPTVHDGSTITLNGNEIYLQRFNTFVDRGIILNNVTGTSDPTVHLISNLNNIINGATTFFSLPADATTGRILINGQVIQ